MFALDFNPRSRVGNDIPLTFRKRCNLNFNPRSRVGNDYRFLPGYPRQSISIHVPAWGTTSALGISVTSENAFQSTFPRGERHFYHFSFSFLVNFNPRSRVGNDLLFNCFFVHPTISIHVPAWGTTKPTAEVIRPRRISIHVPAWGTTGFGVGDAVCACISIHVPAWGTTCGYCFLFFGF